MITLLALALTTGALADEGEETPTGPEFSTGSYGRVTLSSDLQGGQGTAPRVARYGPRLELPPYMELDLGWTQWVGDAQFDVLITPALSGNLFHYDGVFAEELALRNFYAEARGFTDLPLTVWAGSRMYRGDDIYLLDFWPLDNLNTSGGGVMVHPGQTEVAFHVGANRLLGNDWQFQTARVQVPGDIDGEDVLVLDRQRIISSGRLTQHVPVGSLTFRAKLYGEVHTLPEAERRIVDPFDQPRTETLPKDFGSLLGVQLSLWGWADQSFVHLWFRHSTGLAAYGELTIPMDGLARDDTVASARSTMLALTGNHELGPAGVMFGTYLSYALDADGQPVDFDDRWEWVGVLRPNVYLSRHVTMSAEVSHQLVRPNGLNPRSDQFDIAHLTKLSVLPGVQVAKGGYSRPRVHAFYTLTLMNEGARNFFPADDVRVTGGPQHFVGLGAEWWLNSRRVIRPDE